MKLKMLRRTHPEYQPKVLQKYDDLFVGGEQLRARYREYLPRQESEPAKVYQGRLDRAIYTNYVGPIVAHFVSYLFSSPPQLTLGKDAPAGAALPPFYGEFSENCDGEETDFNDFLAARLVQALLKRRAYWRVEFPGEAAPGMLAADYEHAGLGRATVCPLPTENVIHWNRDRYGRFVWLMEYEERKDLLDIEDEADTVTRTWTLWRADGTARRWEVRYLDKKREEPKDEDQIPEVEPPANPTGRLPIVELCLPAHLHLMAHVADPALEHFRKHNAQSYAIEKSCFVMPYFFLRDRRKPPVVGTGYYGMLHREERIEWPAPSGTPFQVLEQYQARLKDEIHRVAHQMARGVDNNAAAIGRSGESKLADAAETEVALRALGVCVKAAYEETVEIAAAGRGESDSFSAHVGGMDVYHLADAAALADGVVKFAPLPIMGSPTGKREVAKRGWRALLPNADESTYQKIDQETEGLIPDSDTGPMMPAPAAAAAPAATGDAGAPAREE